MMRPFAAVVAMVLCLVGTTAEAQEDADFIVYSPYMGGSSEFAVGVTNLLRLQISATFQTGGTETTGRMVFGDYQLSEYTHEQVVSRSLQIDVAAHLAIWGNAYDLADGVAIQTYLSVAPRLEERVPRPEVWEIDTGDPAGRKLLLGLPGRLYEFPPVLVPYAAAREYPSIEGMPIYASRLSQQRIGRIGTLYSANAYFSDGVLLSSGGVEGWVPLGFVSSEQSIVVEFTGAVMRLCRGDFSGASALLEAAMSRETLPTDIRGDIFLLRGLIAELRGNSGLLDFERAIELQPLDRVSATYLLMGRVADAQRNAETGKQLRADIEAHRRLFPQDSPWLAMVSEFADRQGY